MKMSHAYRLFAILNFLIVTLPICARSVHRKIDTSTPWISSHWKGHHRAYINADSRYDEYPLFSCQQYLDDLIQNHTLPLHLELPDKDNLVVINRTVLNQLLEELVREVLRKKNKFKNFIVLQNKNFNRRKTCGLLVLKSKQYPFVVKLFLETPKTFINPFCKGFEPIFLHYMSNGANRHVSGLTRIANRQYVLDKIDKNPYWQNRITIPRKWFWMPQRVSWIELNGHNIGEHKNISAFFPSVYAIVAESIDTHQREGFEDRKSEIVMELCNDLDTVIDPHITNFIVKEDPISKKPLITIIDTEHFPTMLGLDQAVFFNDHFSWIAYLASKCLKDIYFRPKSSRNEQLRKKKHILAPKK